MIAHKPPQAEYFRCQRCQLLLVDEDGITIGMKGRVMGHYCRKNRGNISWGRRITSEIRNA